VRETEESPLRVPSLDGNEEAAVFFGHRADKLCNRLLARAKELKAALGELRAFQAIVISNVAGVALREAITRALPARPIWG